MDPPAVNHRIPYIPGDDSCAGASGSLPAYLSALTRGYMLPAKPMFAFSRGFLGAVMGGIVYSAAPEWLQLRELPFGGASIFALATVFGVFEVWRTARVRQPKLVRARMLFILVASLVVLLAAAEFALALNPPRQEDSSPARMAPSKIVFC